MAELADDFERCSLTADGPSLFVGRVPDPLLIDEGEFEQIWQIHPTEYLSIRMYGRPVPTPRWQQAYGMDYCYAGQVSAGLPTPSILRPFLQWANQAVCTQLNGILVNWHDGQLGHYIGPHRDSTTGLIVGAPIVTISLGEDRVFRLRPWKGQGFRDFRAGHGTVFVMPYATNLAFTHEVPHGRRNRGRRISVTLRAFAA